MPEQMPFLIFLARLSSYLKHFRVTRTWTIPPDKGHRTTALVKAYLWYNYGRARDPFEFA
jgi:hypothetical protein